MLKRSLLLVSLSIFLFSQCQEPLILNTRYGVYQVDEPVLIDLLNNEWMQRLKKVNQYGLDYYTYKPEDYNRYDHSVGVFVLARKYGANITEQIAALLHDVSHTAFSHVADYLYKSNNLAQAYQDDIEEQFLRKTSLSSVLESHGFTVEEITQKDSFAILEQSLPDICADRLEYNLYGGVLENLIDQKGIERVLGNLEIASSGKWFFKDASIAKEFASISLYLTEHKWIEPELVLRNVFGARALKHALAKGIITYDELHFGNDEAIWLKLNAVNDAEIAKNISRMFNASQYFVLDELNFDLFLRPKFRGIDPWIKTAQGLKRLTELDADYKKEYERVKALAAVGCHIKFITSDMKE